ncbi:hypothetical protein CONPUDRAFT_161034 [Coniophora puteana RWD-64-598 SS2]|uniref:Uncharacterized protein n=1 Tax=Coniophora puteana (strain RWD-64-598) TaxID=741705 RepID=A0A5M3N4K9_CONPW|nr:uncharacterized protein CONPUDRAFT_161034 [Coniophora puteana RWD-64-598 SS2]EIW86236.1 hypothetical protein CONPUDRAFT_161034 [Coniophora puteana RWD-64-598 SS2]
MSPPVLDDAPISVPNDTPVSNSTKTTVSVSDDAPRLVMEKPTPIRVRMPVCRPEDLFHLSIPERLLPITALYELHYGVAFCFSHFETFAREINPDIPDSKMDALVCGMMYLRRVTRILNLYVALVEDPGRTVLSNEFVDAETGGIWILSICGSDNPWAEGQPSRKAVNALSRILGEDYHWWVSRQPRNPK